MSIMSEIGRLFLGYSLKFMVKRGSPAALRPHNCQKGEKRGETSRKTVIDSSGKKARFRPDYRHLLIRKEEK